MKGVHSTQALVKTNYKPLPVLERPVSFLTITFNNIKWEATFEWQILSKMKNISIIFNNLYFETKTLCEGGVGNGTGVLHVKIVSSILLNIYK